MTNKEMDTAILDRLAISMAPLSYIHTTLERPGSPSNDRQLDRRLSALKRAGKIRYLRKADGGPGWALVE